MPIRVRRLLPAGLLLLGLAGIACGGQKPDDEAAAKVASGPDSSRDTADPSTTDANTEPVGAEASSATAPIEAPTGAEAGEPVDEPEGETAATTAGTEAAAEPAIPPEEQIKALLTEASSKKTKDERALEALDAAKLLEASPNDLAKAANKRGEALMADPERATKFFEWAQAADPKYPNATFNLAKLAANTGDIPRVKELLTEVKARKGKKLLQQVEFDPSFALVADDPEVLALLR
jgi:hypothetical protein